jgi:hypothetical protein
MDTVIVGKPKTEKPTINIGHLIKKITNLSYNADAVYESRDWPYLWPKKNGAASGQEDVLKDEELAPRKTRSWRFLKISFWGLASISMYIVMMLYQDTITEYFTRGGFFTLAVVGTALAFALVHGSFAGQVLEKLNYRAANRKKDE